MLSRASPSAIGAPHRAGILRQGPTMARGWSQQAVSDESTFCLQCWRYVLFNIHCESVEE
jgi:hypothetical protein